MSFIVLYVPQRQTRLELPPSRAASDHPNPTMTIDEKYARYQAAPKFNHYGEELYCICRKPDKGQLMICCDGCENWFHFRCLRLKNEWQPLVHRFYCHFCEHQGVGVTKWKRKCRLSWCCNPVTDSKYCTKEHGLAYIREALEQLGDMKKIVNLVQSHEHLMKLGQNLPEPPAVSAFHRGDSSQLPSELADELKAISDQIALLNSEQDAFNAKVQQYNRIKDAIKLYNEAHTVKGKKVDICGYNRDEKAIVDEEGQLIADSVCLNDRRRCIHNGWLNLLFDEAQVQLGAKTEDKKKLENQVNQKLQQYLVSVYENEGVLAASAKSETPVMPETNNNDADVNANITHNNGDIDVADVDRMHVDEAKPTSTEYGSASQPHNDTPTKEVKPEADEAEKEGDTSNNPIESEQSELLVDPMEIDDTNPPNEKGEHRESNKAEKVVSLKQEPQDASELNPEEPPTASRPETAQRKPSIANLLS